MPGTQQQLTDLGSKVLCLGGDVEVALKQGERPVVIAQTLLSNHQAQDSMQATCVKATNTRRRVVDGLLIAHEPAK